MQEHGQYSQGTYGEGKELLAASSEPCLPVLAQSPSEATEDEVTGRAGLTLVVEAFQGYRGHDLVRKHLKVKKRARGYSEAELVETVLLLQSAGGEHLEDVAVLGEDGGLFRLLNRQPPSPDAVRDFLLRFHDEKLMEEAGRKAEKAREPNCFDGIGRNRARTR